MDRDPNTTDSSISDALSNLTHGVYVLATRRGRETSAMTASWVTRASERPPCIAVAVSEKRYTHDRIMESGTFALSILREDQVNAATYFSESSGEYHDKFQGVPYGLTPAGSPYLLDSLSYLDCKVLDTARAGDHTLLIGEVTAGETFSNEEPLIYDPTEYESALR